MYGSIMSRRRLDMMFVWVLQLGHVIAKTNRTGETADLRKPKPENCVKRIVNTYLESARRINNYQKQTCEL